MTNLKIFNEGVHSVSINNVELGQLNRIPFLKIYFLNNYGYIRHKISMTGKTEIIFKILFNAAGLEKSNNYRQLIGRKLNILVKLDTYINANSDERTMTDVKKFISLKEDQAVKISRHIKRDDFKNNSISSFADIFGTRVEDIAESMRKDLSEITRSEIMENCGY